MMETQGDWMTTARRMWLWPVSILIGFPIGGYVADLVVDGVDSIGAAVAAGETAFPAAPGSLSGAGPAVSGPAAEVPCGAGPDAFPSAARSSRGLR